MDSALRQTIERVRDSAATQRPLRIRGGGTKDFHGGAALLGDVLDTRALAGVVDYEPSELVVTVRAGTPLAELEALLASRGQCLPFEPPHFGDGATVGGMVAAGLSGPARASAGAVRDFVLGVEIVNGRAECLRFGGQVMKNVAGYDVSRLMVGAWGTLGLITEVSLKVLPIPPAEATLRFELPQAEALRRLQAWGGQPLPLNASRWESAAPGGGGVLHLRLRGATAAVESACRALGGERLPQAAAQADWAACREQALPWFAARPSGSVLWRLSVPPAAPALVLPAEAGPPLVEWHGGLRWLQAPAALGPALREAARAAGGDATVFIANNSMDPAASGPDRSKDCVPVAVGGPGADAGPDAVRERIHARLRATFDPAGIFNPGRLAGLAGLAG
ncbi:glycolate oxidase subunit GlcE [Paracidovorax konjaci]|uniref:Glycolate oxidase FAD binding subunit n=1 Tax=Paracidovorax konjaci TaxID=32040 RepID=A0A1I1UQT0_9BURK|nr:glycolate oxidase subunit GlcE [Paracidovorax konjaci]SFD71153.1 glycolate oxidase FAD binding subunit [Paracidovorax konjaci]